ncbi:MAG: DUF262 domain-containing protein [Elusimicrobiales bacterium]
MKTETHSIAKVLSMNSVSFFIPPFQRSYAWGKNEIKRFFSDIMKIINSELDINEKDKLEHFFGTLVIREERCGFANKFVIVDGQQRLTTTLLFLIALRDLEKDFEKQNFIDQTYLKNNLSTFDDKIKLKQVTKDWEAYKALVNKEPQIPGIITSAYSLLKSLINKENNKIKFEHYITAINRMNVAVIFLDERPFKGEDPQIIFETLNSLGKPLTLSDLVRNFILLNMHSDEQSNLYERKWHPEIENVLGENCSNFFRDYLQYRKATSLKVVSDNNTKELYQEFKEFVNSNFKTKKDFIEDIVKLAKPYKWIIDETFADEISKDSIFDKKIKELLRNIFHDITSEAFKPFVLGLLEYYKYGVNGVKLDDETLISVLESIMIYLIRRRILSLTQGENKNIVLLVKKIEHIAKKELTMFDILSKLFYKLRLPNDDEVANRLKTVNFYEELKQYSKFILGKIEEHNSKVSVDFRDKRITIEHIMPRKLSNEWEAKLGEKWQEIHNNYLHNIGNIILTEFNSEIGNKSFEEKKEKLKESSLKYRLDVINEKNWNEKTIIKHQQKMIKRFLEVFAIPDKYKYSDNWISKTNNVDNIFSILDEEILDISTGSKPVELYLLGNKIKVNHWRDVFIEFLNYLRENEKEIFDFIIEKQSELFGNDNIIVDYEKLKKLIEDEPELKRRYKSLDGLSFDEIMTIGDKTLFLHVNISANGCIQRIKTIIEELIEDLDVKIKII